ncbi:MAG TPA: hypothetical protein VM619_10755 [Luteimonas sp.]|nr:hypothetical protein [Luteimonas sp.]
MSRVSAEPLPEGYWWSESEDGATLFLRYGWAATVTPSKVEVRCRDGRRLSGRCGSIAQGKRFVTRWLLAKLKPGGWRRAESRAPLLPPAPPSLDRAYAAVLRPRRPASAAPQVCRLPAEPAADDWETWAWRQDVPLERLKDLSSGI